MHLIGFNGLKGSGKNTAFQCLASVAHTQNETSMERGLADKLKLLGARTLGFEVPDDHLIDLMNIFKNDGSLEFNIGDQFSDSITGRQYLQNLGNHARTVFGDSFWVDQVLPLDRDKLRALWQDRLAVVDWAGVTDVRYPNEAQRVLALGGVVIEITRPGCESDGHVTELPLPPELVTTTIENDGSKLDLRAKIAATMNQLRLSNAAQVRV